MAKSYNCFLELRITLSEGRTFQHDILQLKLMLAFTKDIRKQNPVWHLKNSCHSFDFSKFHISVLCTEISYLN